jgi:tetratricopeptide (TPR) repeat protein
MSRTSLWAAALSTSVLCLAAGDLAMAAGAGSGGMGPGMDNMPSQAAPQYDPVQEYQNGVNFMQAGNYRNAARAFQRVVSAQPDQASAWFMLGQARAAQNDWRGARGAYQRAIREDADPVAPHRELGLAAVRLRDTNTANAQLAWLQQRQTACAGTCAEAADLTAAVTALQAAMAAPAPSASATRETLILATADQGDSAYLQAVSLINERRFPEALAALDTAERAFGPHPDVLTYQGYVWRRMGDPARAETYYRRALAVAPNHIGALEYYGELKVATGDVAGARHILTRLEGLCAYGCIEADTLRRWIDHGGDPQA